MGSTQLAFLKVASARPSLKNGGLGMPLSANINRLYLARGMALAAMVSLAGCISSSPQVANLADVGQAQPTQEQQTVEGLSEPDADAVQPNNVQPPSSAVSIEAASVAAVDPAKQQLLQTAEGVLVAVPIRNPNLSGGDLALASLDQQRAETPQLSNAENQPVAVDANNSTSAQPSTTTELALLTPQKNQRLKTSTSRQINNIDDGSGTRQAIVATPSTRAVRNQATRSLKRPSFLARLFKRPKADVGGTDDRKNPILRSSRTASRSNQLVNSTSPALTVGTSVAANGSAIPGVRVGGELFGIKSQQQSGVQVASVTSLSRLSPKSLKTQHSGVNVDCINPKVIAIVNIVQQRYGKQPVVTSGYRSPSRNRRAGGARNSMHIYCKAVDIQVKGVSKWNLAKFIRTIPGRGGVGTYCRTKSVHVDIGPKRDWHHSCRRKSKRRRRKS